MDHLLPLHSDFPLEPVEGPENTAFRRVPEEELYGNWSNYTQNLRLMERALRRGGMCFVAQMDSRIVSHIWCVPDPDAASVFLIDAFTRPEARGKNVLPALVAYASRSLHTWGWKHARTTVSRANPAANRAFAKLGFAISPDTPTPDQFFATAGNVE